jgi:hypothetical protein
MLYATKLQMIGIFVTRFVMTQNTDFCQQGIDTLFSGYEKCFGFAGAMGKNSGIQV